MAAIFISHSNLDRHAAEDLQRLLRDVGFQEIFLDFDDRQGIPLGSDWERKLYYEIERCHALLVILTKNWLDSKWCFAEFTQARALGKLIYVVLEKPPGDETNIAKDIQVCDFITNREVGLRRLHDQLSRSLLLAQSGFPFDANSRSPFPGFNAFEEQDAAIFFGRDPEINGVIEKVKSGSGRSKKTLILLGGSGTGKSSLLKAGALPRLRRERDVDGKPVFLVALMRPGASPLRSALTALRSLDPQLALNDLAEVGDAAKAGALIDRLRTGAAAPGATLILGIDQAEEMFAAEANKRTAFVQFLSHLIEQDNPARLVLSMRADHLEEAQGLTDFAKSFDYFAVQPIALDRLGEIINGPARRVDLTVDPQLVDAIRGDAATADALPLVAFVLSELYRKYGREAKRLDVVQYQAMRQGEMSPLEAAVRNVADEALKDSTPEEQTAFRTAFIPGLARIDEQRGVFTKKEALAKDLPAAARRLIGNFVDARLLVQRTTAQGGTVEVAHEALFRVWPTLAGWLDADRDLLTHFQGLQRAAREWAANGKGESWLIHRDARLMDAEKLAARDDVSRRFEAVDREYLAACRKKQKDEEEARAAIEREREAARQKELDDAKRVAEVEGQRRRTALVGSAVAGVLAALAAGSAIYAGGQWTLAEQRRRATESALLVAQSKSDIQAGAIRKAIADAEAAYGLTPTREARSALFGATLELSPQLDAALDFTPFGKPTSVEWLDKETLAVATADGRIGVFRALPGDLPSHVKDLQASEGDFKDHRRPPIVTLRRLPSGALLAVFQNGQASIVSATGEASRPWSIATPDTGGDLEFERPPAISDDGTVFAYSSPVESKVVRCPKAQGGEPSGGCKVVVRGPRAAAASVSASGKWVVFGFPDGTVTRYDVKTLAAQSKPVGGTESGILAVVVTPDDSGALAWAGGGEYLLLDMNDLAVKASFKSGNRPAPGINFHKLETGSDFVHVCNPDFPAIDSPAKELCFIRLDPNAANSGSTLADGRVVRGPRNSITAIASFDKGSALAALDSDNFVSIWRWPAPFLTHTLIESPFSSPWLALSTDRYRKTAAGVTASGGAVVVRSARAERVDGAAFEAGEGAIAASRSGDATYIASDSGHLAVMPDKGEAAPPISFGADIAERGLAWTGRGKEFLLITKDGQLAFIDLEKAPAPAFLDLNHGVAQGLAVNAAARRAYVQYDRGAKIIVVDLDSKREIGTLPDAVGCFGQGINGGGTAVDLSPDGRWLASTTLGKAVYLYDLTRPAAAICLETGAGESEGVSFAADSRGLATINVDGAIAVWDIDLQPPAKRLEFALPAATRGSPNVNAGLTRPSLAWLEDGALIAIGRSPDVHIFNLDEKSWSHKLKALDINK
jgi:WD40 repeat protein